LRKFIAIAVILLLMFGCTGPFGFVFEEDCEDKRDSEKISCLHLAAVTTAQLTESADEGGYICNRIMDEIGAAHPDDDIGRRAETERLTCIYDVVKATARYDTNARGWCNQIEQRTYQSQFFGSEVSREMCVDQYYKLEQLGQDTQHNEGSLCNMVFGIIMSALMLTIYYRK